MDVPDESAELIRRGEELRARSEHVRAAADEKMEKSRQLIAAAVKARAVVMRANGWEPPRHGGSVARHR